MIIKGVRYLKTIQTYIVIKQGLKLTLSPNSLIINLFFLMDVSIVVLCTIGIIILKSYALNIEFQHFILKFNKISSLCK
jgi:hypothetical protein